MGLSEDLERVAEAARAFAAPGEALEAVIAAEPAEGLRLYLCGYAGEDGQSWLVLDASAQPVRDRALVREAVAIAAICELAEESAAGGDPAVLRAQLRELRLTEAPEGIEEAEEAALALERTIGEPPRVASPGYLDRVGTATLRLERALSAGGARSPFAESMKASVGSIEELKLDVEAHYKETLL